MGRKDGWVWLRRVLFLLPLVSAFAMRDVGVVGQAQQSSSSIASTAMEAESSFVYACPMHPEQRGPVDGKCPLCGMEFVCADQEGVVSAEQGVGRAEFERIDDETAYMCPMHPDYTTRVPGTCPRCGMPLVLSTPYDIRDYRLDVHAMSTIVKPNAKTTLRFRVCHPGTGRIVKDFETVHDRRYHLFVIGESMEHFEHIHPEQKPDGSWSIDVTLPKAGYYRLLSDFSPSGGTGQFITRPLVTSDYEGDLIGNSARLVPDLVQTKTVGDMTATVIYDPPEFVAGQYGHIAVQLVEVGTKRAITDLQVYLGAFGHMLIMSEDMVHYVHSHPIDIQAMAVAEEMGIPVPMLPPNADPVTLRGGPEVMFEGLMPKQGRYRAWAQFLRNDKLYTFPFTFDVASQVTQ